MIWWCSVVVTLLSACLRFNRKPNVECPRATSSTAFISPSVLVLAKLSISPARWTAFEILHKVDAGGFSSTLLAAEEPKLEPADRALCHELVLGVLRWQLNLDKRIEHYLERKVSSLDVSVLIAL